MKKLLILVLSLILAAAPAMADTAFDLVIRILDKSDTEEYTVSCEYKSDSNTVFYIVDLTDTALEFAVKGSDSEVLAYRQMVYKLANTVKSAFGITDNPDVNINVGIFSHDEELIIVSSPEKAIYQGLFTPWNDRSADYLTGIE